MRSRAELAGSAAVLAVAVFGVTQALRFRLWTAEGPGEGLFPLLLSALLGALSLASLAESLRRPAAAAPTSPILWRKLAAYVVVLLAYAALFSPLGYLLSTLLVFVVVLRFVERLRWALTLAVTLGTLGASHLLFERLLRVPLPPGLLP